MQKQSVLVVEDEEDIVELVEHHLLRNGYDVRAVNSGEEALRAATSEHPDLILLDLMLPGLDGLDVCRRLKREADTAMIPIIMVTARGEEADIVTGLELGADDYVTKPFSPRVLIARVSAVLRRGGETDDDEEQSISVHNITIDPARHDVRIDDESITLTATEFNILYFLAAKPGRVFTRYQIVDAVRGPNYAVTERAVDVQIVSLRKKLGPAGALIETVRGVGYRLQD